MDKPIRPVGTKECPKCNEYQYWNWEGYKQCEACDPDGDTAFDTSPECQHCHKKCGCEE